MNSRKAAANAALDRRSRSRRARSRRLPVSRNLLAAARHAARRRWSTQMVDGFKNALTPEMRTPPRPGRPDRAAARDAGLAGRKGNRHAGRAAARRGGVSQPDEDRDGHAGRSDGDLRAAEGRQVQRQPARATTCSSTRPTTPIATRACRPGRSPRPAGPRCRRRRNRPTSTICISSARTTARTCSRRRSPSTTATCSPGRWITSASSAHGEPRRDIGVQLLPPVVV